MVRANSTFMKTFISVIYINVKLTIFTGVNGQKSLESSALECHVGQRSRFC